VFQTCAAARSFDPCEAFAFSKLPTPPAPGFAESAGDPGRIRLRPAAASCLHLHQLHPPRIVRIEVPPPAKVGYIKCTITNHRSEVLLAQRLVLVNSRSETKRVNIKTVLR
jgi:hypothetical protein